MSFLFGDKDVPQAAPVPQSPSDNEAAAAERQRAADAALAERAAAGRQQTIVAGMKLAQEDQQPQGLLSAKRRSASRSLVG